MSKDKQGKPADEAKDMAVEIVGTENFSRQGLRGHGGGPNNEDKENQWLAALERASFAITDDRLDTPVKADPDAPYKLNEKIPEIPVATQPATNGARAAAAASRLNIPIAPAFKTAVQTGTGVTPLSPRVTAPQSAGPRVSQSQLGQSFAKIAAAGSGTHQRFQALLNQASFFDMNLQLTQSNEGTVLWIRDFKQKYSQELHHWALELQTVLEQQGKTLSRIMVNGKPINHISDILER